MDLTLDNKDSLAVGCERESISFIGVIRVECVKGPYFFAKPDNIFIHEIHEILLTLRIQKAHFAPASHSKGA